MKYQQKILSTFGHSLELLVNRALPLGLVAVGVAGLAYTQAEQLRAPFSNGPTRTQGDPYEGPLRYATEEELDILALLSIETVTDASGASYPVVRVTGADVQLVNGQGATDAGTNGLGNLLIGYAPAHPGMSHSVLLGTSNTVTGYGSLATFMTPTLRS